MQQAARADSTSLLQADHAVGPALPSNTSPLSPLPDSVAAATDGRSTAQQLNSSTVSPPLSARGLAGIAASHTSHGTGAEAASQHGPLLPSAAGGIPHSLAVSDAANGNLPRPGSADAMTMRPLPPAAITSAAEPLIGPKVAQTAGSGDDLEEVVQQAASIKGDVGVAVAGSAESGRLHGQQAQHASADQPQVQPAPRGSIPFRQPAGDGPAHAWLPAPAKGILFHAPPPPPPSSAPRASWLPPPQLTSRVSLEPQAPQIDGPPVPPMPGTAMPTSAHAGRAGVPSTAPVAPPALAGHRGEAAGQEGKPAPVGTSQPFAPAMSADGQHPSAAGQEPGARLAGGSAPLLASSPAQARPPAGSRSEGDGQSAPEAQVQAAATPREAEPAGEAFCGGPSRLPCG